MKANLEPPILSNGRITGWGKMYLEFCGGDYIRVSPLNTMHDLFMARFDKREAFTRIQVRLIGNPMPAHRN